VLATDLGAVFLPQEREGDALAGQFLVDAPKVGLGVSIAGARTLSPGNMKGRKGLAKCRRRNVNHPSTSMFR
jgi:hypothetical protein